MAVCAAHGGEPFSLIKQSEILAGGPPKDGIPALTMPNTTGPDAATYLKESDRVIGVTIGGESRAYPLRILVWHEIANDVLGGVPIAVTYCPLCDSALVFDRRAGEQTREFGVSGKLYRSNVLMYDRQKDEGDESLWSQLQMRAVVGPAAREGLKLELLPSTLTTWSQWRRDHPDTTVLSLDTGHRRNYAGTAYASYFANDHISFGSRGAGNRRPDLKNKDRVVVARVGEATRIYVVKDVLKATSQGGEFIDELGGLRLRIIAIGDAESLSVEAVDDTRNTDAHPPLQLAYTFWFAWEDLNPGVEIWKK